MAISNDKLGYGLVRVLKIPTALPKYLWLLKTGIMMLVMHVLDKVLHMLVKRSKRVERSIFAPLLNNTDIFMWLHSAKSRLFSPQDAPKNDPFLPPLPLRSNHVGVK